MFVHPVTIMTYKFVEFIPPLKKGGKAGFSYVGKLQIPLTPPFSMGDVMSTLLGVFRRCGNYQGNIHAS